MLLCADVGWGIELKLGKFPLPSLRKRVFCTEMIFDNSIKLVEAFT